MWDSHYPGTTSPSSSSLSPFRPPLAFLPCFTWRSRSPALSGPRPFPRPPSADLLHLITARCFAKVIIDLLHALPEQALLHRICVFRHFVVKIVIQVKIILLVSAFL
jgi:hypothetical protein